MSNVVLDYTTPDTRGVCGFCGREEGGYAKQKNGVWVAACWKCVKPTTTSADQKRKPVGTVYTEDLDVEEKLPSKAPGLSPSTYRPKVK